MIVVLDLVYYSVKAPTVERQWILLINTLDQHLDQYSIDILVDTGSTLDHMPVDSWPCVDRLICINRKLVDSRLTVDQVSIKCQLSLNWGVYGVSIEYWLSVDKRV